MITKKDFKNMWEDCTKEEILNRFYQEHCGLVEANETLIEMIDKINKAIKYIENVDIDVCTIRYNDIYDTKKELLDILKGE